MWEVADFVGAELIAVNGLVLYFQSKRRFPSWTSRVRVPSPAPFLFNNLQRSSSLSKAISAPHARTNGVEGSGASPKLFILKYLQNLNASRARWQSVEKSVLPTCVGHPEDVLGMLRGGNIAMDWPQVRTCLPGSRIASIHSVRLRVHTPQ